MSEADRKRLDDIRRLFDQSGFELLIHEDQGQWRAAYVPKGQRLGAALVGMGATEVEAAEAALKMFDQGLRRVRVSASLPFESLQGISDSLGRVFEKSGTAAAGTAASGKAQVEPPEDPGNVNEASEEPSAEVLAAKVTDALAGYGWKLWFEEEPDGSVTALLISLDTDEVLKVRTGEDYVDAYLALGIETQPPSQEVRRETQRREQT